MASIHSPQTPDPEPLDVPTEAATEAATELPPSEPGIAPKFAFDTSADYSVPPSKLEQLSTSKWRPIAAFGGALLVGGILLPLTIQRSTNVEAPQIVSSWQLSLPASSTMITQLSAAPGKPIFGKVSPVADITGKAPVGGAVARWAVQPGTPVQAGQDVVQISSGAASAAPLPGESQQIEAEQQQTIAADDQMALAKRLTTTQQKLVDAQKRVERAQENIGKTRAVIAKLRAGGSATVEMPPPVPRRKTAATPDAKITEARAATRDAQTSFDGIKAQLDSARADVSASQKSLAPLQSRLDDAQKNVTTIEGKFDGSLASASDVQAARSARDSAKSTLKSATTRLETAQKQIPILEKQLAARERAVDDARRAERAIIASAPADAPTEDAPAPGSERTENAGNDSMSVEAASKLVQDALAESRAATREADRLRAQVDLYQAQAQKSNQRITSATRELQTAQQDSQATMVQRVPRVRFTAATAPANGVVVWIASLAREVGAGQSVFGMSSGKTYRARFEDRTGDWKKARVGQVVNALLAPPATQAPTAPAAITAPAAQTPSASDAGSPPMPMLVSPAPAAKPVSMPTPELSGDNALQQGATPVKVRLTRIAPPEKPGDPAILEGELVGESKAAGPNSRLLASLPNVGAPSVLAVPDSALVERDGVWMVAVIAADGNDKNQPQAEVTPASDKPIEAATPATGTSEADAGTLEWRTVQVGESDGTARRVNGGLKAGERIVTDPLPLLAQAPPDDKAMPHIKLSLS